MVKNKHSTVQGKLVWAHWETFPLPDELQLPASQGG